MRERNEKPRFCPPHSSGCSLDLSSPGLKSQTIIRSHPHWKQHTSGDAQCSKTEPGPNCRCHMLLSMHTVYRTVVTTRTFTSRVASRPVWMVPELNDPSAPDSTGPTRNVQIWRMWKLPEDPFPLHNCIKQQTQQSQQAARGYQDQEAPRSPRLSLIWCSYSAMTSITATPVVMPRHCSSSVQPLDIGLFLCCSVSSGICNVTKQRAGLSDEYKPG